MSDAPVTMNKASADTKTGAGGRLFGIAKVSAVTALALPVADMIGTGVFTSLGFQVPHIGFDGSPVPGLTSGFALLMLWVVGGIAAMCGALAYSELAAAFPRDGGEYNFLSRAFHPAVGFLSGWISATIGFAAPVAVAAMAFGGYFKEVVPGAPPGLLGLGVTIAVSLVHFSGTQRGSILQNVSTFLKLGLIIFLIVAGLIWGQPQDISLLPSHDGAGQMYSASFAISLVYVLYAFSGWNAATYIAGDVKDAPRNLPRSIIVALSIVTLLYVALNAVFLYRAPISELAGKVEVASIAGEHIFGDAGGRIVAALICVGLVSSISAMMWIGPRVTMVMGQDIPLLRAFARTSGAGVPTNALLFQLGVACVLMLTQSFEKAVNFIGFALTLSSFTTVLGLIVLRFRLPDLPRPYKAWGYPVTPFMFLAVTAFVLVYQAMNWPVQSGLSFSATMAGLLVYGLSVKFGGASAADIFSFRGRITRDSFWITILGLIGLSVGLGILAVLSERIEAYVALFLIFIPLTWTAAATYVKRWHDANISGWYILLSLIPIVNIGALVACGICKGTEGPNMYGPDPMRR